MEVPELTLTVNWKTFEPTVRYTNVIMIGEKLLYCPLSSQGKAMVTIL